MTSEFIDPDFIVQYDKERASQPHWVEVRYIQNYADITPQAVTIARLTHPDNPAHRHLNGSWHVNLNELHQENDANAQRRWIIQTISLNNYLWLREVLTDSDIAMLMHHLTGLSQQGWLQFLYKDVALPATTQPRLTSWVRFSSAIIRSKSFRAVREALEGHPTKRVNLPEYEARRLINYKEDL